MNTPTNPYNNWQLTPREKILRLIHSALQTGSTRFARQSTLSWLAYFPGDLEFKLLYGMSELQSRNYQLAVRVLSDLCQSDPEYLEAWEYLAQALGYLSLANDGSDYAAELGDSFGSIYALSGKKHSSISLPDWSEFIHQARKMASEGNIEGAGEQLHNALMIDPLPPLAAVTHLDLARAMELPPSSILDLASFYHDRFPNCIAPILILAEQHMTGGEQDRAVAELHRAASLDVTGQVAIRLWGADHPYQNLWPKTLEAPLTVVPPAEVAALYGWNKLSPVSNLPISDKDGKENTDSHSNTPLPELGDTQKINTNNEIDRSSPDMDQKFSRPATDPGRKLPHSQVNAIPETLRSVQAELERIAGRLKRNQLAHADGRFPVYVILTSRGGISEQYGKEGAEAIDLELQRLASVISASQGWGAILLYCDDPDSTHTLSLSPVERTDAWGIKLLLSDLDNILFRQGEMIAALLIVGGPEIIPFHQLPNPVDDVDPDVPSDNPYSTRDENYFIPEWPVGRLPGGNLSDPTVLIDVLRKISDRHARNNHNLPWYRRWLSRLNPFHKLWIGRSRPSWGITAAIWRRASLSVFRPIGDPQSMSVSPPAQVEGVKTRSRRSSLYPPSRLGYFNLHGLQDASEWFGQRDPMEDSEAPDYPIALRPEDVLNGGRAPHIVFSEACYGANIMGKSIEEALALKFLASGSQSVVGSTCTSYGSITTPLIAADLLGHAFWKFVQEGLPAGEALRRGKIHLAKEMHRRQGYLDGEDQKTLISFQLYGDPLSVMNSFTRVSKGILRSKRASTNVKVVCDKTGNCSPVGNFHPANKLEDHIPSETIVQVKQVVEKYLPGFRDAEILYSQPKVECNGEDHNCPTSRLGAKSHPEVPSDRRVITLRKQIETPGSKSTSSHIHRHYARLTLDGEGKIIKLALSR